ncbi:effector-associated constant component EACC1 [Lentzea sp. NPDC055074]
MTAVHRPLSAWISHLDGSALEPVNDGDDRHDARAFTYFDEGWTRTIVRCGHAHALALTNGSATVVELDNFGRPIFATSSIAAAVERVEQNWPHVHPDPVDFAEASIPLRYWLLQRLDEEGSPPDEAFAVLPWELLDRALASLLITLDNPATPGELVEMRHWLTPAVRGLTGPLEQLDHGLRTGDEHIARLGASGLLDNLRHIRLTRVPASSLVALSKLVWRLATSDPALAEAERLIQARIHDASAPRTTSNHPAVTEIEVRVGAEGNLDELVNLRNWLHAYDQLDVQVKLVRPPTLSGHLGGAVEALVFALSALDVAPGGFAVRVFARALSTWVARRRVQVEVTLRDTDGSARTVVVPADHDPAMIIRSLLIDNHGA